MLPVNEIIMERGLFYKIVFKVHTEYFDACLPARQVRCC
jgi:hypothetical protein